jgi:hypothetical protein
MTTRVALREAGRGSGELEFEDGHIQGPSVRKSSAYCVLAMQLSSLSYVRTAVFLANYLPL